MWKLIKDKLIFYIFLFTKIISFLIQNQICYLRKETIYMKHHYEIQEIFASFLE